MTFSFIIFVSVLSFLRCVCYKFPFRFLHCKALRTAMYKRYINSIVIIIIMASDVLHVAVTKRDISCALR